MHVVNGPNYAGILNFTHSFVQHKYFGEESNDICFLPQVHKFESNF